MRLCSLQSGAFCVLILALQRVHGQGRVAPGVSPQHYQQVPQAQYQPPAPPQQHFQQHPPPQHQQQYQQHPPQQQFQQQHQQINQQHAPQGGGHPHAHSHPQSGQILNAAHIQQEKAHIAEHLEVPIDTSKMSDQELQFHYFKMHDADNNDKLDGCELIKSLIHWHEQGHKDPNNANKVEEKLFQDEELVNLIDPILTMDDLNQDGYIDYPEFVRAQQKAAAGAQQVDDKRGSKMGAMTDGSLEEIVDPLLKEMDANLDGYIDYAEYKLNSNV